MAKAKYTYQSYDYSFLNHEPKIPCFQKVYAKTIGYDLATVEPMNAPTGQLFYFDPIMTTDSTTTNENITQRIAEASNEIERRSSRCKANYMVTGGCASSIMGELNRRRRFERTINRTTDYFRTVDFYKRLKHIKYGKKI